MKKSIVIALVGFTFIGTSYFLLSPKKTSAADVDVHIGIAVPLPTVVIPAPPAVILIPTMPVPVYYAPDVGISLFFYSGHWYQKHNGYWYIATYYNGPWVYLPPPRVPPVLVQLPANYHNISPGHQRIPYGQLKKNWKKWEKEHHRHHGRH